MQELKKLTEQELNILFHMQKNQIDEMNFRRNREFKIFIWTSSLFSAIIGILIAVDNSKQVLWDSFGITGRLVTTVTLVFLIFFSIKWQNRERKFENGHKKIVAKINKLLFTFEKGFFGLDEEDTLYPNNKKWKNWGNANIKTIKRYFRGNFLTATWLLGLLAILMIWLS